MSDPPRTTLPDARRFPRFAGLSTFARFPVLDGSGPAPDWVVYPFDTGVTYRPGARFGPRAIREQSAYVKPYHLEHDVHLVERLRLADAGDAPVRPYSTRETQEAACAHALTLGDEATRLLALGGDHSVALANLRATHARHGGDRPLAVLHLDAHLDTVDSVWGETHTHASPFIRAIEEEIIDPARMLSIGIRGPLNTADDLDYGRDQGIDLVTAETWRRGDGAARIASFLDERRQRRDALYVTFDIDVVDPAFAPGTGTPSVGGLTSDEVLHLLRQAAGANVVGGDVVEVLPDRDPAGITAFLAAHVAFEILCLDAVVREP